VKNIYASFLYKGLKSGFCIKCLFINKN